MEPWLLVLGMLITALAPTIAIFATGRVAAKARQEDRKETAANRAQVAAAVEEVKKTTAASAETVAVAVAEVAVKAATVAEAVAVVAEKTEAAVTIAGEAAKAATTAEQESKKRDEDIHKLVNSGRTELMEQNLLLMKAHLVTLESVGGSEDTVHDMKERIDALQEEITRRDAVAASLTLETRT